MNVLWLKQVDATWPQLRDSRIEATDTALADLFAGQRRVVLARFRAGLLALLEERFEEQLAAVLLDVNTETALQFALRTESELAGKQVAVPPMLPWLSAGATATAGNIVASVEQDLAVAIIDGAEGIGGVFDGILAVSVGIWAATAVTNVANFGAHEGARVAGAGTKTWQVNSGDPRDTHAAMSGETVPLREAFSNGMRWPGDPTGGSAETANCQCSMRFE